VSVFEDAKRLFFEGMAAIEAKQYVTAEARFRESLALNADRVSVATNLAAAVFYQERIDEALVLAKRAIDLDPNNVEAWLLAGRCYDRRNEPENALATLDRVVAIRPDHADAWVSRGALLADAFRFSDAVDAFTRGLALAGPKPPAYVPGDLLHTRLRVCDWRGLGEARAEIIAGIAAGRRICRPFPLLSVVDDPAIQLACARISVADEFPSKPPRWHGERYAHDRIRVAYLSPDFRGHPVALLTAGLFEHHDKRQFETIAISVGRDDGGPIRARIAAAFETFHDARKARDPEIAAWVREREIDILVDLAGHTQGGRLGVLAERPAPVQVSYIGHPGTSGAPYVDYVIADPFVVPAGSEVDYSEKIVRLPDCFQVNDDRRPAPIVAPARFALGLPDPGFVFCSFNNPYKINPPFFDSWMRLLAAVPRSVLWLVADAPAGRETLRAEAEARGVAGDRLIFATRVDYEDHLARLRAADLFLDTLPFNGGTTVSDALWSGVPVVTCAGRSYAARMAGSLLRAVGLGELVTDNLADYEALALRLATERKELAALRTRLASGRTEAALFDTARFCRNLESAYRLMAARTAAGLPPADVAVPPA
jgi:predicted O-linked N-acetylglucosamine transferase (SPINDLY family)